MKAALVLVLLILTLSVASLLMFGLDTFDRAAVSTPSDDAHNERHGVQESGSSFNASSLRGIVERSDEEAGLEVGYTCRLTGRCVDNLLRGIEEVSVECERTIGITDGSGMFSLEVGLGDSLRKSCAIVLRGAGYGELRQIATLHAGETRDLGSIVLSGVGSLSGQTVDKDGRPYSRATIVVEEALGPIPDRSRLEGPSAGIAFGTSEASGSFRLEGIPSIAVRVWAGAQGMAWKWTDRIDVQPGTEVGSIYLQLLPVDAEESIEVQVVDVGGSPVPEAQVKYFVQAGGRRSGGTIGVDENGYGRVWATIRAPHTLLAFEPGRRLGASLARDVPPGTRGLVITLSDYQTFRLHVRDNQGVPVEWYTAAVLDSSSEGIGLGGTEDNGPHFGGSAELPKPPYPFLVRTNAVGFGVAESGPFDPNDMPEAVEITVDRVRTFLGRVLGDGIPIAGARVSLHEASEGASLLVVNGFPARSVPLAAVLAETGEDGTYTLTVPEAGAYYVRAEAEGFAPADVGPIELRPQVETRAPDLVLTRGGRIHGQILQGDAGEPFPPAIVGLSRGDGFVMSLRADAEGRFAIAELTPGAWMVRWLDREITLDRTLSTAVPVDPNDAAMRPTCEVVEGQTTDVVLDRRSLPVLQGRLLLEGTPLSGWTVTVSSLAGGQYESHASSLDSQGKFRIATERTDQYQLTIHGKLEGTAFAFFQTTMQVSSDKEQNWDIDLPTGGINGSLSPERMNEVSSLQYEWRKGSIGFVAQIVIDNNGAFVLNGMPAGKGSITYRTERGEKEITEVEVLEGTQVLVRIYSP